MEKTIKEDNARKVIKQEYLNDNSLYEIATLNSSVRISVRFVESGSIKEHTLLVLTREKFIEEGEDRVLKSEDGKKLALFRKEGDTYQLDRLYDLEEHEFSVADFMDLEYRKHFNAPKLDKYLCYKKENKNV